MADLFAVLLVPSPEHLELTLDGPYGARPPTARAFTCPVHGRGPWYVHNYALSTRCCSSVKADSTCTKDCPPTVGLVLAWDGKPIEMGMFYAVRALEKAIGRRHEIFVSWHCVDMDNVRNLRHDCLGHELGKFLSLNADGREMNP
jgi:hypothetical protein